MKVRVIREKRKSLTLRVLPSGQVEVHAPRLMPDRYIDEFIADKSDWIEKNVRKMKQQEELRALAPHLTDKEIDELYERARKTLPPLVEKYADLIGVDYGRITIRCQHTRWGSCSSKGNLNFNCLLMLTPDYVQEYIVVHELCHRLEMNHSKAFWSLVERYCPDYKRAETYLKTEGKLLIMAIE